MVMLTNVIDRAVHDTVQSLKRETKRERWRGWVEQGPLHIYVRLTTRHLNDRYYKTLDIANIQIDPVYQNNGIFGDLLDALESESIRDVIFIENILATSSENQLRLCAYLKRRGYVYHGSDGGTPCMFKILVERK